MFSIRLSALLFGCLLAWNASGANVRDPNGYERILLPAYHKVPVPGAHGSLWVTELAARNDADVAVQVFQHECQFFCSCPIVSLCTPDPLMEPGGDLRSAIGNAGPFEFGVFLYVQRTHAADVTFNLRVRDLSRSAISLGTELPVVRESEFLSRTSRLLNISLDSRYRSHLRLFGVSSDSGRGDITVRLFADDESAVLYEATVSLRPRFPETSILRADQFPNTPAVAELPNLDSLPLWRRPERIRIELIPQSPGLVYWAYVTMTNNETQQVTTVTPQ